MNRKLIIHLCIFVAMLCVAALIWNGMGEPKPEPTEAEWELATKEDRIVEDPISGERKIENWKAEGPTQAGKMMVGIVLLVVVASYGGIVFVTYLLPSVVHRFTHMFYGSNEEIETDPMHDARALFAQGDFEGAIAAYRGVAAEQPENRFPWVEMAKIHHDNLENPEASIKTLREALESYEWRMNDAAFFMFRLAELYEEDKQDMVTATGILQQVVDTFPDTRHAANATHRLRELGAL
ncbi:MAG: tetratricopeptide repeat protein [Akkermansiaceae bacterium]|jgi:tetratricopeptide (TPR) repeat protein